MAALTFETARIITAGIAKDVLRQENVTPKVICQEKGDPSSCPLNVHIDSSVLSERLRELGRQQPLIVSIDYRSPAEIMHEYTESIRGLTCQREGRRGGTASFKRFISDLLVSFGVMTIPRKKEISGAYIKNDLIIIRPPVIWKQYQKNKGDQLPWKEELAGLISHESKHASQKGMLTTSTVFQLSFMLAATIGVKILMEKSGLPIGYQLSGLANFIDPVWGIKYLLDPAEMDARLYEIKASRDPLWQEAVSVSFRP